MISMLHCDCMEYMAGLPGGAFDLAIVDPEYGRGESGGKDRSGMVKQNGGNCIFVEGNKYAKKEWDKKPVSESYFSELFRVSKNQIIWGENYYFANFGPGRIIWDKCNEGSDQSDCEIAFNSLCDRVDLFRFMWRGMMQGKSIQEGHIQQGNKQLNESRIHPTQKPVALYKWLLSRYAKPGDKILDTHGGSGSICLACHDLGYDLTWMELDADYYKAACERYQNHAAQATLFNPKDLTPAKESPTLF